jgi:hypothetical protein
MKAATKLTYASPEDPFIKSIMIKSIERLTGRRKLQNMYGRFHSRSYDPLPFALFARMVKIESRHQ